jgi:hypothetical protein
MVGARRDIQPARTPAVLGRPTKEILALVDAELRGTAGTSPVGAAQESSAAQESGAAR